MSSTLVLQATRKLTDARQEDEGTEDRATPPVLTTRPAGTRPMPRDELRLPSSAF